MEPKAKTIIERLGFKDPDRKKPTHDEIQLWVYRNFITILKGVFPSWHIDENANLDLCLEYAISSDRNFIVGFVDVFCARLGVAVEIKSEIRCLGDLIRQIQFYRKYLSGPHWIVVCPDDRAAKILNEQGIHFFRYKKAGELF